MLPPSYYLFIPGTAPPSVLFNNENEHIAKDAGFYEISKSDVEELLRFTRSQWQGRIWQD